MPKVHITETVLRDGHQSLIATRMRTEDMLPICDKLDKVGFWSLEVWGGATFDACLRFLKEDPWERLRKLRQALPNTRLQMLLRGQNLLGYRHYSDDVVEAFVERAAANGIDVFRIFDALNDTRNLRTAIDAVKKHEADCAISAGNTGALMAMSMHQLRTIEGIDRPAIAALWPTKRGQTVVLDVGANIECDAHQLVDFAIMGEAFARAVLGLDVHAHGSRSTCAAVACPNLSGDCPRIGP